MKTKITLEFDDSFKETLINVLPLLKKYNVPATFSIVSNFNKKELDGLKIADEKDVQKIVGRGHEIASHSHNHVPLAKKKIISLTNLKYFLIGNKKDYLQILFKSLTTSNQISRISLEDEISLPKKILDKFYDVRSLTYPGGAYDKEVIEIAKREYDSARTTERGINKRDTNRFKLKAMLWNKNTSSTEAKKWVKETIKKQAWLIEVFHLVTDKNTSKYYYSVSLKEFEKHLIFLKNLEQKKIIVIKTRKGIVKELQKV